MKNILLLIGTIMLPLPVLAGSLDPVPTPVPVSVSSGWTGGYIGGFIGGSTTATQNERVTTETIQCGNRNCDVRVPEHLIGNADIEALPNKIYGAGGTNCGQMTFDCIVKRGGRIPAQNPLAFATALWLTGPMTVETGRFMETSVTEEARAGIFAGYRKDLGDFVVGTELSAAYSVDTQVVTKTAELNAGLDLGAILPYAFGGVAMLDQLDGTVRGLGVDYKDGSTIFGVKYTEGVFGTTETQSVDLRVAITF